MQEALNSPYGVGPSALPEQNPAPDTQFMQQMGQVRIPQAEGAPSLIPQNEPAPVVPPQDPDAALQKVDPMDAAFANIFSQPDDAAAAEAPSVGKPSFEQMSAEFGPVEATKRSVGDSLLRAKLSFAQTDWENIRRSQQLSIRDQYSLYQYALGESLSFVNQ